MAIQRQSHRYAQRNEVHTRYLAFELRVLGLLQLCHLSMPLQALVALHIAGSKQIFVAHKY